MLALQSGEYQTSVSNEGDAVDVARAELWNESLASSRRAAAADTLLARWEQARAATLVMEALSGRLTQGSAGAHVLDAIARSPSPPREMFRTLADRLSRAEVGERAALLAALSAYRTREACDVLIEELRRASDDVFKRQVAGALTDLTGHDLGADHVRWSAWLDPLRALTEADWRQTLVGSLGARARALRARADAAESRLVASMRRLHLAVSGEARSDLISELLRDPSPVLRDLGFDLVERELAANASLEPKVGEAAVAALASSSPASRARAANLVRQMKPLGSAGAIADALLVENDARAASSLLLAAQRFPTAELSDPALRWASEPGPARGEAFALLWTLTRAGEIADAGQRERVLSTSRSVSHDERTPAVIHLLAFLGDDDDAQSLRSLLWSESPELRQAAAQSLLWDDRFTDDLLDAASRHVDLFRAASLSQLVHRPTVEGFRRLVSLPRQSGEESLQLLMDVARGLTASEVLALTGEVVDTPLRNELLADLAGPVRATQRDADDATRNAIAHGSWLHANRLFRDGRYADAVRTLEGNRDIRAVSGSERFHTLHVAALLAFGRSDLAQQSEASAEDWLDAIEMVSDAVRAGEGMDAFARTFTSRLTPEQRQRFDALRRSRSPKPADPQ